MMPQTGATAPDFTLPRDGGGAVSLAALKGAPVVLYFYPRDDTSGCTREALDFTALSPEFGSEGAHVLGISRDTVASHDKFVAKHDLGIALLSDAEGEVCKSYGVWVSKTLYGRTSMGIQRATFLVDRDGIIRKVWPKVRVEGHAQDVLEAVRAL